ncbi:hypothetical protein [uncultured Sphingomonas sp.]|uniref:hypothetical protein n=1 Tax=uncultured Sphingomonas sp. TaxID=158754 RepID=UPI0026047536|nr:hypothetical protein [uncultured Sphingomonas sp.]
MRAPHPCLDRMIVGLLAAGLFLRLLWLTIIHGAPFVALSAAEACDVAIAFARTGMLADAYFPGQGPTAHLMPLNPAVAGWVMRWLGVATRASATVLTLWSIGQVFLAYLILLSAYGHAGLDRIGLRGGAAILFLLPIFVPQEVIDFRYWEGGTALLLAACHIRWMMTVHRGASPAMIGLLSIALTGALLTFVAPPVGLAVAVAWGWTAWHHLAMRSTMIVLAIGLVAFSAMSLAWAVRNEAAIGVALPSRSNLGVELAMANYPQAVDGTAPEDRFNARLFEVHPAASHRAQAAVRRYGERAYALALQRTTLDWMAQHPRAVLRLYLRHLVEFLAPQPWQFYFTGWEGMRTARSLIACAVSMLGLAGLIVGIMRRQRMFIPVALYVAALALQFAMFQPMPRYSFLVYPLLAWPAAWLVGQWLRPPADEAVQID